MRKEIDLRAEPIGTYEFPLPGEKSIDVKVPVYLRNLTLASESSGETALKAKLFYTSAATSWVKPEDEQKKRCSATFELDGHGYTDLESFKRLCFSGTNAANHALLKNIYCTEATELLPMISPLGIDTLHYYDESNLKHTKDVNRSHEAHILKALFIHCLAGRLYFWLPLLAAKLKMPAKGGARSEYSFHIQCDGTSEIAIALKLTKGDFLEIASAGGDEYQFLL